MVEGWSWLVEELCAVVLRLDRRDEDRIRLDATDSVSELSVILMFSN